MRMIDADAFVLELRAWARTSKEKAKQSIGIRKWQYKTVQWTLQALIKRLNNGAIPTIEAEPVRHGPCPYCDAETNDFILLNQTFGYSGIEMMLNRQGMLRVRVYEPGDENFNLQEIIDIKRCPYCGAKMGKEEA